MMKGGKDLSLVDKLEMIYERLIVARGWSRCWVSWRESKFADRYPRVVISGTTGARIDFLLTRDENELAD